MISNSKLGACCAAVFAALCASVLLSGCMAVHSIVAPMMQSGMQSAVEANATPDSMDISTSTYRGKSCSELSTLAQAFVKTQNDPATEPFTRKTMGWNVDAINQVRREQACDGGVARVPASGEVPMFGFCWYAEPSGSGTIYFSTVFAYADWFADYGQHEQKEFDALLKSRYNPAAATSICVGQDSRPRADAAREKLWGQMFGNLSSRRVSVAWTPLSKPPPRKPVAKAKAASAPANAVAVAAPASARTSGLQLGAVDEATAKKLALNPVHGALVTDVARGGTAAKAGLRAQDVIVEIGGQEVNTPDDAQAVLDAMRPGFNAPLRVWRARKMHDLTLEVAPR